MENENKPKLLDRLKLFLAGTKAIQTVYALFVALVAYTGYSEFSEPTETAAEEKSQVVCAICRPEIIEIPKYIEIPKIVTVESKETIIKESCDEAVKAHEEGVH